MRRLPTDDAGLAPLSRQGRQLIVGGDSRLLLIDAVSFRREWAIRHPLADGIVFRPRPTRETIIAASRKALAAFRLSDGRPRWIYMAQDEIGAPWVDNDIVCFGDGNALVCLASDGGQERWRFAAIAETKIHYAPVATADTVYAGAGDGRLYALDRRSGELRWQIDGRHRWQYLRQLQLADHRLIAGAYTERLLALDLRDGHAHWEFATGNFLNTFCLADGAAFFWSPTGWLYAVDLATGWLRWRLQTTDYRGASDSWAFVHAEIASWGETLFALDLDNHLHLVCARRGIETARWAFAEALQPFVLPLTDRHCVCGSEKGELLLVAAA